jgi:hypothetical protein
MRATTRGDRYHLVARAGGEHHRAQALRGEPNPSGTFVHAGAIRLTTLARATASTA